MTVNLPTVMAQTAEKGVAQPQSFLDSIMGIAPMILVMAVIIYFMWRSQKKEQKRRQEMMESIKVGDRVVTIGGICGEVVSVKDAENKFVVKIADNVKIEMLKTAVVKEEAK